MFFDESARLGSFIDHFIAEVADVVRDHMLSGDAPLSEKRWRVAGYRFARALAQNRLKGFALTREFAEGMRSFSDEHCEIGPPVLYDVKRADAVEEKAEKLLSLATHEGTSEAEAAAAKHGFTKLFAGRNDLAIISHERLNALMQMLRRQEDSINFIKQKHPTIFLWKTDERRIF